MIAHRRIHLNMTAVFLLAVAVGTFPSSAAAQDPSEELYLQAREHLIEERHDQALALFRRLVDEYPQSERADDAQYYVAYTLERQGLTTEAIEAYGVLLERWPDSVRVESAQRNLAELQGKRAGGDVDLILQSDVPWDVKRETAYALARSGNLAGESILEEAMRREGSSRKLELIGILAPRLQDPAARRILAIGLEPGNSSSVQLQVLVSLGRLAGNPEVARLVIGVLERNESSSVQQKAIQILAPHIQVRDARLAIIQGLQPHNSSSVQIMAASALAGHMLEPEVKPAVVRLFTSGASTSVQLQALNGLERQADDPGIAEILEAAVRPGISSSVQLKAMSIARSSRNPQVRAVGRAGLAPQNSSSVQLEATKVLMQGRDEPAAADALLELFRQGGMSSSVQLSALEALELHMATPSGPLALAAALNPSNSTSVLLRAVRLAGAHIDTEPVRTAVLLLLEQGDTSTSVQLEAVRVLEPRMGQARVRAVVATALRPSNSTSVQLSTISALEPHAAQPDVRRALVGALQRRNSTSVILASLRALEGQVGSDQEVRAAFLRVMEDEEISSSARILAGGDLVRGANEREKKRIADAMEDVIIRLARQGMRTWPRDTIEGALDVVEKVDSQRAAELRRRYGRPPSLLQRLFDPPQAP